ncbi:MAG: hypothetical protein HUJ51_06640 [Eggerthellaceae bacterium]|nr:hypothetical protein [Eggerthellaceae bacterium]
MVADCYGRKNISLFSMATFAAGSVIRGFTGWLASDMLTIIIEFCTLVLFGRTLQAVGGCWIIQLATAEIGITAPLDKQGMYLSIIAVSSSISGI